MIVKQKTAKCLYCKKIGHYARVCRKKINAQKEQNRGRKCKSVRALEDPSGSDSDEFVYAIDPQGKENGHRYR